MRKISLILLVLCFALPAMAEVKPYFTPSMDCERKIVKLIDNAENNIDVVVYSLTNDEIVKSLKQAYDKGIKIRILTDRTQAGGKGSKVKELYLYGLNIRVHSKHRIEHNKVGIFDNDKVVTGSYNWSNNASKNNSENCLFIIRNKSAVNEYVDRFGYLWRINTKAKSDEWFIKQNIKTLH